MVCDMKNGDSECTDMAIPARGDNDNDWTNIYSPYKNWCLVPVCVSVMDGNYPEEQKGIMAPPYHTHICMYNQICGHMNAGTAVVNDEEEITFHIRCASVNMLAASAASLLAIAYNF
jgi:hypothetical protein